MDKIWSAAGLDMCLMVYSCVSTDASTGIIEVWQLHRQPIDSPFPQVVSDAATTAEIQKEYAGVTGALKKTPLSSMAARIATRYVPAVTRRRLL